MLIGFGASCGAAQIRFLNARRRAEALEQEKLRRIEYAQELSRQLDYMHTDAFILQTARDELNLILPGEIRYIAG